MFKQKFIQWYQNQIGWTGTILIALMLGFATWGLLQRMHLSSNPAYTKGVLIATHKGAKGSMYWDFTFYADENEFKSSAPISNCKNCSIGDSVIIKYQLDNPDNNELISKSPANSLSNK